jgi:hypothetical protein
MKQDRLELQETRGETVMLRSRSGMLAVTLAALAVTGARAQMVSVTADAIYERPSPVYAVPPAVYGTPEIAFAMTAELSGQGSSLTAGHVTAKRGAMAPSHYGDVVSRGAYPLLAANRCVTDLGYGRWETCD